jgi:hypothetical protein
VRHQQSRPSANPSIHSDDSRELAYQQAAGLSEVLRHFTVARNQESGLRAIHFVLFAPYLLSFGRLPSLTLITYTNLHQSPDTFSLLPLAVNMSRKFASLILVLQRIQGHTEPRLKFSSPVSSSERAQYSAIIDEILASGDLQTISAKQIRKGLQARLGFDISDKKVSWSGSAFLLLAATKESAPGHLGLI